MTTDLFPEVATDWQKEREVVLAVFTDMLRGPTGDGSTKRQAGAKPVWWRDPSHEAAFWRHIAAWKSGQRVDPDSGQHPLQHAFWRLGALCYQQKNGQVPPPEHCKD